MHPNVKNWTCEDSRACNILIEYFHSVQFNCHKSTGQGLQITYGGKREEVMISWKLVLRQLHKMAYAVYVFHSHIHSLSYSEEIVNCNILYHWQQLTLDKRALVINISDEGLKTIYINR